MRPLSEFGFAVNFNILVVKDISLRSRVPNQAIRVLLGLSESILGVDIKNYGKIRKLFPYLPFLALDQIKILSF